MPLKNHDETPSRPEDEPSPRRTPRRPWVAWSLPVVVMLLLANPAFTAQADGSDEPPVAPSWEQMAPEQREALLSVAHDFILAVPGAAEGLEALGGWDTLPLVMEAVYESLRSVVTSSLADATRAVDAALANELVNAVLDVFEEVSGIDRDALSAITEPVLAALWQMLLQSWGVLADPGVGVGGIQTPDATGIGPGCTLPNDIPSLGPGWPDPAPPPGWEELVCVAILAVLSLLIPVLLIVVVVAVVVVLVVLLVVLFVVYPTVVQLDVIQDRLGDAWADAWSLVNQAVFDSDGDGLENLREFRWDHIPVCGPANCQDLDGDAWLDGPEVTYWNDESNDAVLDETVALAFYDSDRTLNTDGDTLPNVRDADSDNDDAWDGLEATTLGTYPELVDSDCATAPCTPSTSTDSMFDLRQGQPGSGDGMLDGAEDSAWTNLLGPGASTLDIDGDGVRNILDRDSENDGLLDGEEFLLGDGQVHPDLLDTEGDGVRDGQEVAWHEDTDLDGSVNANDHDSDDDGMPDGWEVEHNLNMVDPSDAQTDRDGDLLNNVGEYVHGTDPENIDTEADLVLDGEEVNVHGTNPLFWDTDGDGMPDRFETVHGLRPLDPMDAGEDGDQDVFDVEVDGSPEQVHPNLEEYRYGRPPSHNEVSAGPWLRGTSPRDPDTDQDRGWDSYEVFYGTDPTLPADADLDRDEDGLNWTQEVLAGTDSNDADTDGDGLCDGGNAAACTFPNMVAGFHAGEATYGTTPYAGGTDTDGDGIPDGAEASLWDRGGSGGVPDTDGDRLHNLVDYDSDSDRLRDGLEVGLGTQPAVPDSDGDGLPDGDEYEFLGTPPTNPDADADLLTDGEEILVHGTDPRDGDTDNDGLSDAVEVRTHGTSPFRLDTDADGMPDAWEVNSGTQPNQYDAGIDEDGDGLTNLGEYQANTDPKLPDSDQDTMPDGWEVGHSLNARLASDATADADSDSLLNREEHVFGTDPRDADTDDDLVRDGDEAVNTRGAEHGTDPANYDTDGDHLGDGEERLGSSITISRPDATPTYTATSDPLVPDTDGDGAEDGAETSQWRTDPRLADSDGDRLTDYKEAVQLQGVYSPTHWDTDNDGTSDAREVAAACPTCDDDRDGLINSDEVNTYGTSPIDGDTDDDGLCDGSERSYWGPAWSTSPNQLLSRDFDGDGLTDGDEVGQGAYPKQAGGYKTNPANPHTDADTVPDGSEERLVAGTDCPLDNAGSGPTAASAGTPGVGLTQPTFLPGVLSDPKQLLTLSPTQVLRDAHGAWIGRDAKGPYVLGAFGVRMRGFTFPDGTQYGTDALGGPASMPASTAAGPLVCLLGAPTLTNSDGALAVRDRINDLWEMSYCLDPKNGDTDADGIPDDRDGGITLWNTDPDGDGLVNAGDVDSDSDGLVDAKEDLDLDGRRDMGESNPLDADTDDDGIHDNREAGLGLLFDLADSDYDGLSDGLETGLKVPDPDVLGHSIWTDTSTPLSPCASPDRKAWQAYTGIGLTTQPSVGDSDFDGIIDGLEDLSHDGVFGLEQGETHPWLSDSDGDMLDDGRELLIWGVQGAEEPYHFCQVAQAWGTDESSWHERVGYTGTNLLQTDPRNPTTPDGDSIPDGQDLQPRQDALLKLRLATFEQVDPIDVSCGHCEPAWYATDLVFRVVLATPAGTFTVESLEMSDFGQKEVKRPIIDGPFTLNEASKVSPPAPWTYGGLYDGIQIAADAADTIQFDLPDHINDFSEAKEPSISFQVDAIDIDVITPNPVDLDGMGGNTKFVSRTIDLDAGAATGLLQPIPLDANGSGDEIPGDDDDGRLIMDFTTNLVPYHLRNLQDMPLPAGNCFGGTTGGNSPRMCPR